MKMFHVCVTYVIIYNALYMTFIKQNQLSFINALTHVSNVITFPVADEILREQ